MNSLTEEQLVQVMKTYFREALAEPEEFYDACDPDQAAIDAVDYIFEIAAQQS